METKEIIDVIKVVLATFAAGYALWKYKDSVEKQFRRPFWEQRLKLYADASSAAALIAVCKDRERRDEAIERFRQLYNGPMCIVEDAGVKRAMEAFEGALRAVKNDDHAKLGGYAIGLGWACRDSIRDSWAVTLDHISDSTAAKAEG